MVTQGWHSNRKSPPEPSAAKWPHAWTTSTGKSLCPQGLGYHESLHDADSVNYHCSTLSYWWELQLCKTNDNGRVTRWWFLIRGEEEVLAELQQIWEHVSIQTPWRLEECVVYRESSLGQSEQSDGAPSDSISPLCHRHLPIHLQLLSSQSASSPLNQRTLF